MATPLHLLAKVRSDRIMASAMGQPCSLRIASFVPGRRCSGVDTTVGTHLPVFGKGMSTKVTDMAVAYGCHACHQIIDGPDKEARDYIFKHFPAAVVERMLHGLVETHCRLIEDGIINIPDGELI